MIPREIEVRVYETPDGRSPFNDWLLDLRDVHARAERYWRAHRNANRPLS